MANDDTPAPTGHEAAPHTVANPWRKLRAFTDARIGLGRAGISLPTQRLLEFQLAHAQARDAVHMPLDTDALCDRLAELAAPFAAQAPIRLHSRVEDRLIYLQRPDYGRRLRPDDRPQLDEVANNAREQNPNKAADNSATRFDLALVVVDGLSARAITDHAVPLLAALGTELAADAHEWRLAPLTVVEQGRVAIGDEIGEALDAAVVVVLIGERPGLSSPDSLGLYLTWAPHVGATDAERNCISNVRPAGLAIPDAARRLLYLLNEARRAEHSGVALKDRSDDTAIEHETEHGNFLTS